MIRVDANTQCLPDLTKRIGSLEETRANQRGGLVILGVIWTALWAGIEAAIHIFWRAK